MPFLCFPVRCGQRTVDHTSRPITQPEADPQGSIVLHERIGQRGVYCPALLQRLNLFPFTDWSDLHKIDSLQSPKVTANGTK